MQEVHATAQKVAQHQVPLHLNPARAAAAAAGHLVPPDSVCPAHTRTKCLWAEHVAPPARPPARSHARIPVSTAGARGQGCAPPSEEFIATVCKNAAHLRLKRFKSVGQEFDENWAQQLVPLLDGSCSFDGSVDKNVIWFVPGASLPPPGAAP
jgi:hypothetical protein